MMLFDYAGFGTRPKGSANMAMNRRRLLLVASAGGHWVQLSRLTAAFETSDALYVTTRKGARAPSGERPVICVQDASRTTPFRGLLLLLQMAWIVIMFRPHVVISTGAAPGLLALRLAKIVGARTCWIDSIANSEELSLSGVLAGGEVDLWLTQWDHLVDQYPGIQHKGAVL